MKNRKPNWFQFFRLNRNNRLLFLIVLILGCPNFVLALPLDPSIRFSTKDSNGDGIFETLDSFDSGSVFNPGVPINARIAHIEFDLTDFTGDIITSAFLEFQVFTNNWYHQTMPTHHDRAFDVNLYVGNGLADLSDSYQFDNIPVRTLTYNTGSENGKFFNIDLTSAALTSLGILNNNSYLGVSIVGLPTHNGGGWGPSLWRGPGSNNSPLLSIETETASVPEPSTILLFGTGFVGLAGSRIRRKGKK